MLKLSRNKYFVAYEGIYRPIYDITKKLFEHKIPKLKFPSEIVSHVKTETIEKVKNFGETFDEFLWIEQLEKRISGTIKHYEVKNKENTPFIFLIDDLVDPKYFETLKRNGWEFLLIIQNNKTIFDKNKMNYILTNDQSLNELYQRINIIVKKISEEYKCS